MKTIHITSQDELPQVAGAIIGSLGRRTVVAFRGEMGAGKSVVTRAAAQAMGVTGPVPSPTFTILYIHEGSALRLYHFDLYRLESADALYEMGLEEYIPADDGASFIEWPEMAGEAMPQSALTVTLTYTEDGLARCAQLTPGGAFDESRIAQILTHMEEDDEHPDD